ncbi:MAG: two-component sensor histidine kinase [Rhodocyclales bacterium]|nr:two-component sensor histidine kinase [Rhodocyclales bacterium]
MKSRDKVVTSSKISASDFAADGVQPVGFARKGWRIFGGMIVYLILATALIASERHMLFESMSELEAIHGREERQLAVNYVLSHAILTVNENYLSEDISTAGRLLTQEVDGLVSQLSRIEARHGGDLGGFINRLRKSNAELQRAPSRGEIALLRETLHELVLKLDQLTLSIRGRKAEILEGYRTVFSRLTLELFLLVAAGVVIVGGIGGLFFRRLARDIGLIKARAGEIVLGYRGEPLPVTRSDELGVLMSAINDMEAQLKSRDSQLELGRQQHFHTEKMAAVGSLAAAVAHEINNPLAAIVGLAESLVDDRTGKDVQRRRADHQIDLILEQARRVMAITRQIGEFSLQRPLVPGFVDLNALVRSTCTFISFDKRFRGIRLDQELAEGLPAVFVVSDHFVQVLMNLLINAADALESKPDELPSITVGSIRLGDRIVLSVGDNGPGIATENLARVFDPHFTTKPPGRGSGLGLSLCRNLVEQDGGTIAIESKVGRGTKVSISLPIASDGNT